MQNPNAPPDKPIQTADAAPAPQTARPLRLSYWGADLRCRFATRDFEQWCSNPAPSLVGVSLDQLLGPTTYAIHASHISAVLRGDAQRVALIDFGSVNPARPAFAHYVPDGGEDPAAGFVMQITEGAELAHLALTPTAPEQVQQANALRKSEAALKQAQRLSRIGSWYWEIGPDITTWSEDLYRMLGRDPAMPSPSFADTGQLYTLPSWMALQSAVGGALKNGEPFVIELEYVRADGSTGWLESRGAAERDAQGAIVALNGTVRKLSARHTEHPAVYESAFTDAPLGATAPARQPTKVAAHLSESFTRRVLNNLFSFVGVLSADGTVLETNKAPLEAAAISPDAVYGKKFWDTPWFNYSAALQTQICEWCARSAAGDVVRSDIAVRMAGDALMWIDFQIAPLADGAGAVTHLIASAADISARRESEEHMRLATESTGVGVWEWHYLSGRVRWNAQMFRLYGIEPTPGGLVTYEDWRGCLVDEQLVHQEDLLQDTLHRLGTGGREFGIRRRDNGQLRTLRSVETVRADADGQIQWVVGTNFDVTAQRQMEEDLRQASRRKDEFLATLAHELRNPLAPVRNALALMKRADGDPDTLERVRITMERQVAQMVHLIDDLLDVSRITHDQLLLKKSHIDLAAVVELAVETCQSHCEDQAQTLQVSLPPSPVLLDADLVRLAQVLGNLLNNASKFTPRGGRIELRAEVKGERGEQLSISVRDNGIGIAPHMQEQVFELFGQVEQSRGLSKSGLGIGLALARRIAEMHGGSLSVHSEGLHRGSEFVVCLPILQTPLNISRPNALENRAVTAHRLRRVLVVDDNVDGAETLAALLTLEGHETRVCHDGLAAVETARAFQPDVVLLDIGLPKMDGYEACRQIRAQPGGEAICMMAVTGWGQAHDVQEAERAGFDSHCVKPIDPSVLASLLGCAHK